MNAWRKTQKPRNGQFILVRPYKNLSHFVTVGRYIKYDNTLCNKVTETVRLHDFESLEIDYNNIHSWKELDIREFKPIKGVKKSINKAAILYKNNKNIDAITITNEHIKHGEITVVECSINVSDNGRISIEVHSELDRMTGQYEISEICTPISYMEIRNIGSSTKEKDINIPITSNISIDEELEFR